MRPYLWILLFMVFLPRSAAFAQSVTPATVTFTYDRSGLPVSHFVLKVDETGHGRYEADEVKAIPAKFAQYAGTGTVSKQESQHIDRPLDVSKTTVEAIFRHAKALNYFNAVCASRLKNIANTGDKTLTYAGSGGSGSCAYNYSESKTVDALTDIFLYIAFTLDQGRRLDFDHRYDRLGLDQDMEQLVQAVEEKRALEIGAIAETLTSIIYDTAVMQRVRQRAATLLEQAKQTMQAAN